MPRFKNSSIKHKLFISQISLISVAFISFFVISVSYFVVKTTDDIWRNMKYSSNITASNVYNYISSMENCVHYASYNTDIADILSKKEVPSLFERQGNYKYVQNTFILTLSNYSIPLSLTLYPANEGCINFDGVTVDKTANVENTEWYKDLIATTPKFFYFTEKSDGEDKLCIINTIYNPENYSDILGYIKVSADMEIFAQLLSDSTIQNCDTILTDKRGNVLCSTADGQYSKKTREEFLSLTAGAHGTVKIGGKNYFAIKDITKNSSYATVTVQSKSNAYKDTYFMFLILFIILTVIALASYAAAHYASRSVIRSLDTLINAMKRANFGELKQIKNYESSNTELNEAIGAFNNMVKSIDNLVEYNTNYSETLKKYEFNFLQMQIKPHFLYNTLDIIQYLAKENKPDDVTYLIKNLSKFYKISLHNKNDLVKIESEIKHISYYTAIENFKHDNSIKLEADISDEIQNMLIPKITFQPLVENAIKHGILEKDVPEGYIRITAEKKDDDVYVYIEDNGVGIEKNKIEDILSQNSSSVGVSNTDKRLKLFFGAQYGLSIESEPGKFTRVIVKIRAINADDEDV